MPRAPVEVAREIVAWAKKAKELELCAASIDGVYFDGDAGREGPREVSRLACRGPRATVVTILLLSPYRNVVGCRDEPRLES